MYSLVNRPNSIPVNSGFLSKIWIEQGDNLRKISQKLYEAGLIDSQNRFIWACRLMMVETEIPAGIFTMPYGLSNRELVIRMIFNSANTGNVTIREGWTAARIASVLQKEIGVDSADFMRVVNDSSFVSQMGIEAPSLEGYLYPETYNFYLGMSSENVAQRMVLEFKKVFTDDYKNRAFEMGYTVNEIVTLASIIEGEIIFSSEAPLVSGVYHNRLKIGMRLQADPTIQYIIPDGPRRLRYSDLRIDSPYNTYRNKGLPPGPIGNPGKRAIKAALYPAESPYLYFVAKGDGYHHFNVTVEDHLSDKREFNKYRRMVQKMKSQELP